MGVRPGGEEGTLADTSDMASSSVGVELLWR